MNHSIKKPTEVYVSFGGNRGDSISILKQALALIAQCPSFFELKVSKFYQTSPVSSYPQPPFVNGMCRFLSTLDVKETFAELERIERVLGKCPKPKWAPRVIDLDLIFFGTTCQVTESLTVPHPRWKERLFVLVPLRDLTEEIFLVEKDRCKQYNIPSLLRDFPNVHGESVEEL